MTTKFAFGCHSTLAVNPNSFTFVLTRGDAVVAAVPEAFRLGTELSHEAPRDEFSVCLGPAHGEVVAMEVCLRRQTNPLPQPLAECSST